MSLRWHWRDCILAFSDRLDGDMANLGVREHWLRQQAPQRWLVARQVHGTTIVTASTQTRALGEADGIVTTLAGDGIAAFGADCPAVVIDTGDALGIAHAGWRGTAAGIVPALITRLTATSATNCEQWGAWIGPGICQTCYEVDSKVLTARDWPASARIGSRSGHALLSLSRTIAQDCRSAGIVVEHVSGSCTNCWPQLHSFRHDGAGCSQLLAVYRRGAQESL